MQSCRGKLLHSTTQKNDSIQLCTHHSMTSLFKKKMLKANL